jgi:hypothetical protein
VIGVQGQDDQGWRGAMTAGAGTTRAAWPAGWAALGRRIILSDEPGGSAEAHCEDEPFEF